MTYNDILKLVVDSEGVSTDTRTLKSGQIYFALKGDNFDGNDFVLQAIDKGAKAAITSDEKYKDIENVIFVDDVLYTLQKIANIHRKNHNIDVIAITGTNGKTTTKELISALLSVKYNVLSTKGNFNNHIGLPITLLNLKKDHDVIVLEMGASSKGEIRFLCEIAEPTYGLITSIGKAHILGFGGIDNIINTKLELFDYIHENNGVFFYNQSVGVLEKKLKDKDKVLYFSDKEMKGNVVKKLILKEAYPFINVQVDMWDNNNFTVSTNIYGEYNFINITNAIKVADYFNVDIYKVFDKLKRIKFDNNRSQIIEWKANKVILDAYNANPTSVLEALKSFCNIKTDKNKIVILGDMLELGELSQLEHTKIIQYLTERTGLYDIYLIGSEYMAAVEKYVFFSDKLHVYHNYQEAKQSITLQSISDSIILAKGSRAIEIEKIFL